MKSKALYVVTVELSLNEDEARWLRDVMQNPLSDTYIPEKEDPDDRAYREALWTNLNEALKHA